MFYYASLNPTTKVCISVSQSETQRTTNVNLIEISSLDTTLVYRKKYIDGEWVTATPDEAANYKGYEVECNGKWLEELTGDTDDLDTTDKTSLVNAINECFQYASNGKTAIANAITGADSTLEIPTNPTFAQLAALIGQITTMKVATGTINKYTSPAGEISGATTFRPRLVFFKNNQTGDNNANFGLYIDCAYFNFVKGSGDPQELTVNFNEWGYNGGGSASDCFTISDTGWSINTSGLGTNICWIAIG